MTYTIQEYNRRENYIAQIEANVGCMPSAPYSGFSTEDLAKLANFTSNAESFKINARRLIGPETECSICRSIHGREIVHECE
jgi:hypothetical protein